MVRNNSIEMSFKPPDLDKSSCSLARGAQANDITIRRPLPRSLKADFARSSILLPKRGQKLGYKAVVVVQAIQDGDCHQPSSGWQRTGQRRIRIRYSVQTLVNSALVVPGDELAKD